MVIKILVLFGTMFLLMMIGSPIAVALGVATMVTMTATTNISLTTMSTACLSGLDSFPLMAIPFFMLAGNLMKSGGISRRILDFADAVVGWVTGSVGMVTVVASMFFAALSGSSPATVTAIGGITIPEMKEAIVRHIAEVRQQKQAAGVTSTGPQGRGSAGEDRGGRKMRNVILAQMREEYRAVAARYLPA